MLHPNVTISCLNTKPLMIFVCRKRQKRFCFATRTPSVYEHVLTAGDKGSSVPLLLLEGCRVIQDGMCGMQSPGTAVRNCTIPQLYQGCCQGTSRWWSLSPQIFFRVGDRGILGLKSYMSVMINIFLKIRQKLLFSPKQ